MVLPNWSQCPNCKFPASLQEFMKVFTCPNALLRFKAVTWWSYVWGDFYIIKMYTSQDVHKCILVSFSVVLKTIIFWCHETWHDFSCWWWCSFHWVIADHWHWKSVSHVCTSCRQERYCCVTRSTFSTELILWPIHIKLDLSNSIYLRIVHNTIRTF